MLRVMRCGALVLVCVLLSSCGPSGILAVAYDRPAQFEVSQKIKKLGIAEFGGKTRDDTRWGDIASDKLGAQLDEYNRRFKRYELVDRKRLASIMEERDMRISIADSAAAARVGKLAECDAMIYGTVNIVTRDEHSTRTVYNAASKTYQQVPHLKRFAMAAVNFTLDDIITGKTLTSVTATRQYDSDKDDVSRMDAFMAAVGSPTQKTPRAMDQIVDNLVSQCVTEFLNKISPHQVRFEEKLAGVRSPSAELGGKLALAGEHAEAVDAYQRGIAEKPDDHGAMFNCGLVYELMAKQDVANLTKAEEYYDKAVKVKPDLRYIMARKRVRSEQKE